MFLKLISRTLAGVAVAAMTAGAERAGLRHAHAHLHRPGLRERRPRQAGGSSKRRAGLQYLASGTFHDVLLLGQLL